MDFTLAVKQQTFASLSYAHKVRYKGLEKNRQQVLSLMALANVYLLRRSLMT